MESPLGRIASLSRKASLKTPKDLNNSSVLGDLLATSHSIQSDLNSNEGEGRNSLFGSNESLTSPDRATNGRTVPAFHRQPSQRRLVPPPDSTEERISVHIELEDSNDHDSVCPLLHSADVLT